MAILELEGEIVGLKGELATIQAQQDITHAAMKKEQLDYLSAK